MLYAVFLILLMMAQQEFISIYYYNATSISAVNKLSSFNSSFSGTCYNVVSVSETWLHDGINDEEILPELNYAIFRRDRDAETSVKKTGGGVMLCVSKKYTSSRRKDLESVAEILWVEVKLEDNRKAFIGTAYLPIQNDAVLQQIENSLDKVNRAAKSGDTIILLGDENMSDIAWVPSNSHPYAAVANRQAVSNVSERFLELLDISGLHQYNTIATTHLERDRSIVNNHILDLVIGNNLEDIHIDATYNATSSTHKALEITAKLHVEVKPTPSERIAYNFKKVDWDNVFLLLSCIHWSDWSMFTSVDDAYEHFYDILFAVIKQCIPTVNVKAKRFPCWYSKELKSTLKAKERYRRKYLRNGRNKNSPEFAKWCELRTCFKRMHKRDYKIHISNVESSIKRNPKKFWGHVKSKKSSNSLPDAMNYNNITYTSTETILNAFRIFFKSIFIQFDQTTMPYCQPCSTSLFNVPHISYIDVQNILRSLEPSTSTGYDRIPATLLIKCSDHISKPLADLFNLSLSRGVFPDVLKKDNVIPVFKRKGSKKEITGYRAIALQPIIAKVFEGFVNRSLRNHIHLLIKENQHGFLKSKSCATNLLHFTDFVSKCFDRKSQTHVIYTDFRRAFDSVPHELLLLKLRSQFGIENNMFYWFQSYLADRLQRVVINGKQSDWYEVSSGVPQGSILGPTLFLMYINDIFSCINHSHLLLFADDCKIFKEITCKTDCHLLQCDINSIYEWCKTWHMNLHPEKCFFMNFSLKRQNDIVCEYFIGDFILNRVMQMKDLGVHFTYNLNFSLHVSKIASKARQMLGFINRVTSDFTDPKTLYILYNSYVRSRLEFCSQVWNPSSATSITKLERVQKRFLKTMSYKGRVMYANFSYEELCVHFNLKTLQSRRNIADLVFLNKLLCNQINSPYLTSQVPLRVPRRILRDKPTFSTESRLLCRKDTFFPRALSLSNSLDQYDSLVMNDPIVFKRKVSQLFL